MAAAAKKKTKEKLDIRQINFGNVQPQALEMEACIIGSMLINKDAINSLSRMLKSEYFYDVRNEKVYSAIMQLITVHQHLAVTTQVQLIQMKKQPILTVCY